MVLYHGSDIVIRKPSSQKGRVDEEWLDYVVFYRTHEGEIPFDDTVYDVIYDPTADDKLFVTLDMYSDGFLSKRQAIHIINCMNYSCQVVFKNDDAIKSTVRFKEAKELKGLERQNIYLQMTEDRKLASKRAMELIRKNNGR